MRDYSNFVQMRHMRTLRPWAALGPRRRFDPAPHLHRCDKVRTFRCISATVVRLLEIFKHEPPQVETSSLTRDGHAFG